MKNVLYLETRKGTIVPFFKPETGKGLVHNFKQVEYEPVGYFFKGIF